MIRGSILVALVAVLLSLVVHGLGLGVTSRTNQPSPAEAGAADLADVGSTFEDLAETNSAPENPESAVAPDPPDVTPPEQAVEDIPTSQALVASDNPQNVTVPDTGTVEVIEPDATEPSQSEALAPDTAERSGGEDETAADVAVLRPLAPDGTANALQGTPDARPDADAAEALASPPEVTPLTSAETASPLSPEPDPSPGPATILEPDLPDPEQPLEPESVTTEAREVASGSAVTRSLRPPKERPMKLALGLPDAMQQDGAQSGNASGSIESPVTSYKRTGIDPFANSRSASREGATGFAGSRNPGNASTTNYAGQVLVLLNRFPAVRPSVRGAAEVSFGINPDGTVAWINILRSTGSPEIRRAASDQVRRAAPFPPPPDGTSQRLVFTYQRK